MKALIISDDETFYLSLEKKISELGYSTILYKWLLKALDNIDEINPDLIVLSAEDYPRHWKVLVQHIENKIKNKNLRVFLFTNKDFSKEEKKNAVQITFPTAIFPYARQIISQTAYNGGFSNVVMDTIDFEELRLNQQKNETVN